MKTQSEQELKKIEVIDMKDGSALVLLRKDIIKNSAQKATETESAKEEYWEADEKQIIMKNFPGIKYVEAHFDELFNRDDTQFSRVETLEKRIEELEKGI